MNYSYLIVALFLNATANILLKIAAVGENGTTIKALLANPYAVLGVTIFASNVYFYIQALRVLPVSLVYPVMTAVSFIIINTYGILILKEPISIFGIVGYALIILGIMFLTISYK